MAFYSWKILYELNSIHSRHHFCCTRFCFLVCQKLNFFKWIQALVITDLQSYWSTLFMDTVYSIQKRIECTLVDLSNRQRFCHQSTNEASLALFHSTGGRKRNGFVRGILINNLTTKFIKTYTSCALLPSPFCVCYSSFYYDESSFSWQEDTNDAYYYS